MDERETRPPGASTAGVYSPVVKPCARDRSRARRRRTARDERRAAVRVERGAGARVCARRRRVEGVADLIWASAAREVAALPARLDARRTRVERGFTQPRSRSRTCEGERSAVPWALRRRIALRKNCVARFAPSCVAAQRGIPGAARRGPRASAPSVRLIFCWWPRGVRHSKQRSRRRTRLPAPAGVSPWTMRRQESRAGPELRAARQGPGRGRRTSSRESRGAVLVEVPALQQIGRRGPRTCTPTNAKQQPHSSSANSTKPGRARRRPRETTPGATPPTRHRSMTREASNCPRSKRRSTSPPSDRGSGSDPPLRVSFPAPLSVPPWCLFTMLAHSAPSRHAAAA